MWLLDFLFPPRSDEEIVRETSVDDMLSLLDPRVAPETNPATVVLLPFHQKRVRSAIHEAKYHGNEHAFTLLASALSEYLRDSDEGFTKSIMLLVPIPLGKKRRQERGFNQVEEVARRVGKELKIDIAPDLLVRTRETPTQTNLPRHLREKNLKGAFRMTQGAPLDPNVTYILLDDVLTTGATLQAAISALQSAGAQNILPIALAH